MLVGRQKIGTRKPAGSAPSSKMQVRAHKTSRKARNLEQKRKEISHNVEELGMLVNEKKSIFLFFIIFSFFSFFSVFFLFFCGHFTGVSLYFYNLCCCSCSRVVCTCAPVTDRDFECVSRRHLTRLKNLLRVKKHERGNKTSRTPRSMLTVTIGTTGVDLSRYQLHAFSEYFFKSFCCKVSSVFFLSWTWVIL